MTFGLSLYRLATSLLAPILPIWLGSRVRAGKDDPANWPHRFARSLPKRPPKTLIWCHGASIGEIKMLAGLMRHVRDAHSNVTMIYTVQTKTGLEVVKGQLFQKDIAIVAPFDLPYIAKRWVEQMRPDLAVFAESELWPNLLKACDRAGTPRALVNARLSQKSRRGWNRWANSIRQLVSGFSMVTASDVSTATQMENWGASPLRPASNLKTALALTEKSVPISVPEALLKWKGNRRCVLAASTHPGEEALLVEAWSYVDAEAYCLIIAPRHPERRYDIEETVWKIGSDAAIRSDDGVPEGWDIYIADTVGEMSMLYAIADSVYLGGGHANGVGGHNPMEALSHGLPVITGPKTENFETLIMTLQSEHLIEIAHSPADIVTFVSEPRQRIDRDRLTSALAKDTALLDQTVKALINLLRGSREGGK